MSAIVLTPEAVLAGSVMLTRLALQAISQADVADAIVRIAGGLIGADQGALGLIRDGEVVTVAAMMPPRAPIGSHFPVGVSTTELVGGGVSA